MVWSPPASVSGNPSIIQLAIYRPLQGGGEEWGKKREAVAPGLFNIDRFLTFIKDFISQKTENRKTQGCFTEQPASNGFWFF